jgi:spore coat polysaccharide biosynthesis protein SpsF
VLALGILKNNEVQKNMNSMRVVGIIIARLDSARFPNKVLTLLNKKPLLSFCIERATRIKGLTELVLATTDREIDDPLVDYAKDIGLKVYRGDKDNVANRCLECAKINKADYFLRINGDSPFLDHTVVQEGLDILAHHRPDLVTNLIERTYPYGIAVELVRVETINKLVQYLSFEQAEHITKIFYDNSTEFKIKCIKPAKSDFSKCRLVVDTPNDLHVIEKIIKNANANEDNYGYEDFAKAYLNLGL